MPAFADLQNALIAQFGTAVSAGTCKRSERVEHVQTRQPAAETLDRVRAFKAFLRQLVEDALFDLGDLAVSLKTAVLVLFQFRRDEALGVDQRLPARILLGQLRLAGCRTRDLDIKTKDFVVIDFQLRQSGTLALAFGKVVQPFVAAVAQ